MNKDTTYHGEWEKLLDSEEQMKFRKDTRALREAVLNDAKNCVCTDRNSQYGEPEDNFTVIAELWTQYLIRACEALMKPLTGYDVGMMMTLFKIGRMETGTIKRDSFVDALSYLACAAEIALRDTDEAARHA